MNRKTKKQQQALNQRIQKLQQQIAGAKRAADEPGEVAKLEAELAAAQAKLEKLKS